MERPAGRSGSALFPDCDIGGRGAGEAIGLAQRYDQDGANRIDPALPVKGLYAVGADAGGMGIGTERAADSAMNVFERILKDAGK